MKKKWMIFLFIILTGIIFAKDVNISGNFSDFNYSGSSIKEGSELILTQNSENQTGAIWSNKMIDLSKDFKVEAELYMGDKDATGADGIAFFFKSFGDKNKVIGSTKRGLGYESIDFKNAFGIEIDTWYDKEKDSVLTDHIAFITNYLLVKNDKDLGNIEDNRWHPIIIEWDASTKKLSYSFEGFRDSYKDDTEDLLTRINKGNDLKHKNMAYFGYTASTGDYYNKQAIRNIKVDATISESQYPLTITETVLPTKYIAGTKLIYTVTIGNKGTETISNLELSSNTGIDFSRAGWINSSGTYRKTDVTIPAGGAVTVTGTRIATASDVSNAEIINTTYAKGYINYGGDSQEEYTDAYESRIDYSPIDYTVTEISYANSEEGFITETDGTMKYNYKFRIKNTGGTELKTLKYKNTKTPGSSINISDNLAVGAIKEITYEYTLTDAEKNSNTLINEIKINASDNSGDLEKSFSFADISNQVSALKTSVSNTITESKDDTKIQKLGNTVNYSLTIKNLKTANLESLEAVIIKNSDLKNLAAANRTFDGVKASSTKLGIVKNFSPATLGKAEVATGTMSYVITQADIDEGNLNTTIFFKGKIGSDIYTNQENSSIGIDDTILTKEADIQIIPLVFNSNDVPISGNKYLSIGDKTKYSFTIENIGLRTLKNLKVVDPNDDTTKIDLGITSLPPGSSQTVTNKYIKTIDIDDLNLGELNYNFLFSGEVGSSDSYAKSIKNTVNGNLTTKYKLEVVIEEGDHFANEGINLKYHYKIKNTGDRVLLGLQLNDILTTKNGVNLDQLQINPGETAISDSLTYRIDINDFRKKSLNIRGEAQALTSSGHLVKQTIEEQVDIFDFSKINLKVSSPTLSLTYGTLVEYIIDVENTDNLNDAVNLKLIDKISEIRDVNIKNIFENINIVSVKNGKTDVPYTGNLNSLVFTVPKSSTVQIKFTANIKGNLYVTLSAGGNINNSAEIYGKTGSKSLDIPVKFQGLVVTTDVTTANLDKIIEVGEEVTYIIDITNNTSLDAKNVNLIDKINEITNSKNELVFSKPLTTDKINITDKETSLKIHFTYNDGTICVDKIDKNQRIRIEIKATVNSNIAFTDGESIVNSFSVNGSTYSHTLNALSGLLKDLELTTNIGESPIDKKIMLDKEFTYNIEVKNISTSLNFLNVNILSDIETTLNENNKKAFKDVSIGKIYNKDTGVSKIGPLWAISFSSGKITLPEIIAGETIVIEVKATPNADSYSVENKNIIIDSKAYLNNSVEVKTNRLQPILVIPELTVEKTLDKPNVAMGEKLTYTIKITNNSATEAKNLVISDDILGIKGNTSSGLKEQLFLNWTWTVDAAHIALKPRKNSSLNIFKSQNVNLDSGKSIIFTVTGLTNKNIIDDSFSNTVYVIEGLTQIKKEAKATSKINKEGIVITKTANKTEAKRGNLVKYTLNIFNSTTTQMEGIKIIDILPNGFEYMKDSALLTDNDNTKIEVHPLGEDVLTFNNLNGNNLEIKSKETIKLSYILKVGVGVKDGKAINTAMVKSFSNHVTSNIGTYTLNIITDPLFDTGSIIGKVFNDIDEDGYQERAGSKNIKIIIENPSNTQVKLIRNGKTKVLKPRFIIKKLNTGEKAVVEFRNNSSTLSNVKLSTDAGTNIILDSSNKIKTKHSKDKKRGLTGEKIVVKRTRKNNIERIEISNKGKDEEGISGARLMTIDGLIIETDVYGRFHVPVLKGEKQNNYLIKLDLDSLPMGTYITTENPKVMRRTRTISKFNFGVVIPNEQLSEKRGDR